MIRIPDEKTEVGGRKTEGGRRMTEDGGQRWEIEL